MTSSASSAAARILEVPPELACPLCLDLVFQPVLTPCGHSFCRACIARAAGAGHTLCPLCRASLEGFDAATAEADHAADVLVGSVMPSEVISRRAIEAMRVQTLRRVDILVGNRYTTVANKGRNSNKWIMYTTLHGDMSGHTSSLIEKVVYDLHPTFNPSVVTAFPPNFELCRYGWGIFVVNATIHWRSAVGIPPTTVDHMLSFEDEGGQTRAHIEIEPEVLPTAHRAAPRVTPRLTSRGDRENLEVVIGNRVEEVDSRFRWTMHVDLPGYQRHKRLMIDKVVYDLHRTFQNPRRECRSPNFELTCVGWGTFPVEATIHWKASLRIPPTNVVHELVFEPGGGRTAATVGISSQALNQFR